MIAFADCVFECRFHLQLGCQLQNRLKKTNNLITKFENERLRTGFENPNRKNMCWLNASLQAIIALPIFNELVHSLHNNQCGCLLTQLLTKFRKYVELILIFAQTKDIDVQRVCDQLYDILL